MLENKKLEELSANEQKLIQRALEAQKNAYCPYSDYPVGAVVLSENNNIYKGWNVEVVNFNGCIYAECQKMIEELKHLHSYLKLEELHVVIADK